MIEKIMVDVGRGLAIGAGLLVCFLVLLILGWLMDIKEARASKDKSSTDET